MVYRANGLNKMDFYDSFLRFLQIVTKFTSSSLNMTMFVGVFFFIVHMTLLHRKHNVMTICNTAESQNDNSAS